MIELYFVVEYKTNSELFKQKFVYTYAEDHPYEGEYIFINDSTGEELTLQKKNLDYHLTRPLRTDELT